MNDSTDQDPQEKWHPDIFAIDMTRLEQELTDEQFIEMSLCLEKAVGEIKRDPENEGAALNKTPLEGYRKKKFHSELNPIHGKRADMRLVFGFDTERNVLYLFGIGIRKHGMDDDVYEILNLRDKT